MIHRESNTGDTVQLNMIHGTHFQAISRDAFANGRTWGPWLWYLNNGSQADAHSRWKQEEAAWPYAWLDDAAYQSCGSLQGSLHFTDGTPASGAAIFLGDTNSTLSTLDQGRSYYYTTYADNAGAFSIPHIRTGAYALSAWAAAAPLNTLTLPDLAISPNNTTQLSSSTWPASLPHTSIFQIGTCDRLTHRFNASGPPFFQHGRIASCPAKLTYTIPSSSERDWCFAQSALGLWSVLFTLPQNTTLAPAARLALSLAGFSQGARAVVRMNGVQVGRIPGAGWISSQDTYRGATGSGEWRVVEGRVGEGGLAAGENRLEIEVVETAGAWRGWLWDCVVLEWE